MGKKKEYKDVKTFTISRAKWLRGGGGTDSVLLNDEGKMCCLGFYARKCELKPQDIRHVADPEVLVEEKNKKWNTFLLQFVPDSFSPEFDHYANSKLAIDLIHANDTNTLSGEMREKKITTLFKKAGVKVKFVD